MMKETPLSASARAVQRRIHLQLLIWVGLVVLFAARALVSGGASTVGVIVVAAIYPLLLSVGWVSVYRTRAHERRRQQEGEPPSWSASVYLTDLKRCGATSAAMKPAASARKILGRLTIPRTGELRWDPGKVGLNLEVKPLTIDRHATGYHRLWTATPTAWLGARTDQGVDLDIWISDPRDLASHL
jgi:hypothetical protein